MAKRVEYTAVGRRKGSVARIRLFKGGGKITVNHRTFENYFPRECNRLVIKQPLELVKLEAKVDVFANCDGGGLSGQAGAIRLGVARALIKLDPDLRPVLKKGKFLTRDARVRERKKYGRKRARRRFQFTKR